MVFVIVGFASLAVDISYITDAELQGARSRTDHQGQVARTHRCSPKHV